MGLGLCDVSLAFSIQVARKIMQYTGPVGSDRDSLMNPQGLDRPIVLRGGRVLLNGAKAPESSDLEIGTDGRIARVGMALAAGGLNENIEIGCKLVVAGPVDMHQHLDKRVPAALSKPDRRYSGALAGYQAFVAIKKRASCLALRSARARSHCDERNRPRASRAAVCRTSR